MDADIKRAISELLAAAVTLKVYLDAVEEKPIQLIRNMIDKADELQTLMQSHGDN